MSKGFIEAAILDAVKAEKKTTCCICGAAERGIGCNPWPIVYDETRKSRCCHLCDMQLVFPARIRMLKDDPEQFKNERLRGF